MVLHVLCLGCLIQTGLENGVIKRNKNLLCNYRQRKKTLSDLKGGLKLSGMASAGLLLKLIS